MITSELREPFSFGMILETLAESMTWYAVTLVTIAVVAIIVSLISGVRGWDKVGAWATAGFFISTAGCGVVLGAALVTVDADNAASSEANVKAVQEWAAEDYRVQLDEESAGTLAARARAATPEDESVMVRDAGGRVVAVELHVDADGTMHLMEARSEPPLGAGERTD